MKNCPNCSAPLDPYKCKCDYCGTYYYDLTALDVSGKKPTYVKFKTRDIITGKECVLTALAMPFLNYAEVNNDIETVDVGMERRQIINRRCATISMNFELIEEDGKLCTMEVLNESGQNND